MYKVFLNDRLIKIGASTNITLNKPIVSFNESCTVAEIKEWFKSFLNNDLNEVFLLHPEPGWFFLLFQSIFLPVPAAGGVVISENRLLFIFRRGKWDLPKGKIDEGETPEKAAMREVMEETGIQGHRITRPLASTFHIYQSPYPDTKGQWIFKETFWFEMNYQGTNAGIPQTEENITEIKWLSGNELDAVLNNTYGSLKDIILLYQND
jgi:8-oxo-dGTP pyrophosphatase MutT (NUDIX family)